MRLEPCPSGRVHRVDDLVLGLKPAMHLESFKVLRREGGLLEVGVPVGSLLGLLPTTWGVTRP